MFSSTAYLTGGGFLYARECGHQGGTESCPSRRHIGINVVHVTLFSVLLEVVTVAAFAINRFPTYYHGQGDIPKHHCQWYDKDLL